MRSKFLDKKSDRIAKNKKLYQLERKFHNGHVAEIRNCLKNTLDLNNCKIVLEDAFPGIIRRHFQFIEKITDKMDSIGWIYWLILKIKNIGGFYIDLCKDTFLMLTILFLIGGPASLYYFPTKLTSVVVFGLLGTILLPMIFSSLLHTEEKLKKETKKVPLSTRIIRYIYALIVSPIEPLLISEAYGENKIQIQKKIRYNKYREDVLKLGEEAKDTRKNYAKLIRVDIGMEVMFQLAFQITYLLLRELLKTGTLKIYQIKANQAHKYLDFLCLNIPIFDQLFDK